MNGQEVTVTRQVKGMNSTCDIHTAPEVEIFPPVDDNPDDQEPGTDDDEGNSGYLPPPEGDVTAPYNNTGA
ncbi:hypothetical protein SDC9_203249 [bioreactor metagenome]|uniref:Uncharacterized protein n=1 Tax=bioreactor metagenome TaxID=1076179 RepID=A0A645IVX1_9ZZZZ